MSGDPLMRGDGTLAGFVCSRGKRRPACSVTGCGRPAVHACDAPRGARACAAKLCDRCAVAKSGGRYFCPKHERALAGQGELELAAPRGRR